MTIERLPPLLLLDVHLGAEREPAAAGPVAFDDAVAAADDAAGGEVRARDDLQQLVERALRIVDDVDDGVADLAQVVRREVDGHADGDAGASR